MKNELNITQELFEKVVDCLIEAIEVDKKAKVIHYTLSHCLDPRYDKVMSFSRFKKLAKEKGIEL